MGRKGGQYLKLFFIALKNSGKDVSYSTERHRLDDKVAKQ